MKHRIATPFVLLTAAAGVICITVNKLSHSSHPGTPTPLGWTGTALLAFAFLIPALVFVFHHLQRCYREIMDCIWVAKRGTLAPIQVRQEFIDTMGREPTISEVHDLHEMIKSEHRQAVAGLVAVVGGIAGLVLLLHRTLNGRAT